MTAGRRLVPALVLVAAVVLAGSLTACGRFGGNDTNPRSDEKRESAPAADAGTPARALS
jgi:predicted small lipoprotein YifL